MFLQRYAAVGSRTRGFHATGGTVFEHDGMRVHRFTHSSTFQVDRGSAEVEVFVLGPGQHGGWNGGSGGALLQAHLHVSPGDHSVAVHPQPPPAQPGFGYSRFAHLEARSSPHPHGSSAHFVGSSNRELWYGGGGPGAAAEGGAAVGGNSGRGGHGAEGVLLNLWGQQIRVGAGGGGGVRRRFSQAGITLPGGQGGADGGGNGGSPTPLANLNGSNATGYGNGGGGAGGNLMGETNQTVGSTGSGSLGFVVIRYPLDL